MNGKLGCVLAVFCTVMLADTDALWGIRIRLTRIIDIIKEPVCPTVCSFVCTAVPLDAGLTEVCQFTCNSLCANLKKKKRSTVELKAGQQTLVPLPRDFKMYDRNGDGQITIEEFAHLLNVDPSHADIKQAFSYADIDGDSFITEAELLEAPWVFEDESEESDEK